MTNSLPTVVQSNINQFNEVIRKLDPELYLIKMLIEEMNIDPTFLYHVIKGVSNLRMGTRYGRIQIFMQNGVITNIKTEETIKLD